MGLSLLIKVHNITLLDSKNHGPDRDIHFMTCDNFPSPSQTIMSCATSHKSSLILYCKRKLSYHLFLL